MKVLLVNGSGHAKGCTYTALEEVAGALEKNGIEDGDHPGGHTAHRRMYQLQCLSEERKVFPGGWRE